MHKLLSITAAALMLAACGGGGGGGTPVGVDPGAPAGPTGPVAGGPVVPAGATQSAQGAFSFVSSVAATPDNAAEPLAVGDATLATSETEEPQPL